MEMELKSLPAATRMKLDSRWRNYTTDLDKFRKDLVKNVKEGNLREKQRRKANVVNFLRPLTERRMMMRDTFHLISEHDYWRVQRNYKTKMKDLKMPIELQLKRKRLEPTSFPIFVDNANRLTEQPEQCAKLIAIWTAARA
jgi:hypothetical protein